MHVIPLHMPKREVGAWPDTIIGGTALWDLQYLWK
jgi:hypothetical protein